MNLSIPINIYITYNNNLKKKKNVCTNEIARKISFINLAAIIVIILLIELKLGHYEIVKIIRVIEKGGNANIRKINFVYICEK